MLTVIKDYLHEINSLISLKNLQILPQVSVKIKENQ